MISLIMFIKILQIEKAQTLTGEITCQDRVTSTEKFCLPGLGLANYYAHLSELIACGFSKTVLLANVLVKCSKIKLYWLC